MYYESLKSWLGCPGLYFCTFHLFSLYSERESPSDQSFFSFKKPRGGGRFFSHKTLEDVVTLTQFSMESSINETFLEYFNETSTFNDTEWLNHTDKEVKIRTFMNNPYHMLLNRVWTLGFSAMVIMGVFGNGFVLWIILGKFY